MITRFALKMIMGLAPEHSDVGNHRFWEMDKSLTIIKKRCGIHAFPSSLRKMKSPKIVLGNRFLFLGTDFSFLGAFLGKRQLQSEGRLSGMRKKNYKGRCEKRSISKSKEICRTYDALQSAYADMLQDNTEIVEIRCNVPLDGLEYTTDFVCVKAGGDLRVRECVRRKFLTKPLTVKLLDESRQYWLRRGVTDWGLVVDAE